MTNNQEDEQEEFGLVMPFVTVASKGGPHDDDAYTAGWEMGKLDAELRASAQLGATPPTMTLRLDSREQIDLIAMLHGYTVLLIKVYDDWISVEFRRAAEATS